MPHQCVRCGSLFDDGAKEILSGCTCGGRLFFYVKKEKLEEMKTATVKLSKKEKTEIEKDILDIVGENKKHREDETIVLDFEAIRAMKPGVFELDLVNLFNKDNPLVYKLEEGKYVIDIPETFARKGQKSRN